MTTEFEFHTAAEYEPAGVRFNVALTSPPDGSEGTFTLTVDDLASGERVALNHQACPAVHDFTRGYTRWIGSRGIRAERGEDAITGTVAGGLPAPDLLELGHLVVDMIDQRFSNYTGPVIGSDGYSDVVYEKRDGVAWLMLNRPETFNAKRGITMDEMADALLDAARDNEVRAVVISGAGPNGFCTGNDQSYDPSLEASDYAGGSDVTYSQVIRQMPQPVIAAVDGYAIGSGNIMAYECDFTIATSRSRFGQTGPRVGSPAAGHGVAMLAGRIGQKRAREMWMLCQQYSAAEAYAMGLVNRVVEPDQLWPEVDRWIAMVKNVSPVILQMQKISFNQFDDHVRPDKSPVEEHIPNFNESGEALERRTAFLERRPLDPAKNEPYVELPIG
jgi:dihydroxynaphthoic acid synthetase